MATDFCPQCGTARTGERFCGKCGSDFWRTAQPPHAGAKAPTAPDTAMLTCCLGGRHLDIDAARLAMLGPGRLPNAWACSQPRLRLPDVFAQANRGRGSRANFRMFGECSQRSRPTSRTTWLDGPAVVRDLRSADGPMLRPPTFPTSSGGRVLLAQMPDYAADGAGPNSSGLRRTNSSRASAS
jgi:hypothetical protein